MTQQGRRRMFRVQIEAVKGTAIDTTTLYILSYEGSMEPDDNIIQRQPGALSLGTITGENGPQTGTAIINAELSSNGADGFDDAVETGFQGCGLDLTGLVFSPESRIDNMKTLTIDMWEGDNASGVRKRLSGCMGNFNITGEAGMRMMVEFTFNGKWNAPIDEALPTPTYDHTTMIKFEGATFTIGGEVPIVNTISFESNNEVVMREDATAAGGLEYYVITERAPICTLDPEANLVAEWAIYDQWLAKTEVAFSLLLTDGSANVTIAGPKFQWRNPASGDRGGKRTREVVGQFNNNAQTGDDSMTITTAAV